MVGGGVIGAACARAVARRGLSTALFEPGPPPGAASPASAGMLAAQIEAGDDAWLALAVQARERYEPLARELQADTGLSIGLTRQGVAAVAFDDERAAALEALGHRQRAAGLRAEWLPSATVAQRWGAIAPGNRGALLAPDDGAVDPPLLVRALRADGARLGVAAFAEPVDRLMLAGGVVAGVQTPRNSVRARHVVLAAGAWSPRLAGLPRPLPVQPVRGQLVAVPWPRGTPPVALYHDHGYVLRRGDEAILGSTMEHVGFDAGVTTEGQARIVADARRLLPALDTNRARAWAGLRPVTPDGLPLIGPDPDVDGLWYATGHGRNGILLAALTGDVIADLITAGSASLDINPFAPQRFASGGTPHTLGPRP